MPFVSPLRYPGGKRRLAPVVAQLIEANRLHDIDYVEPYAGGASLALAMLFNEYASTVYINDLSRPVFAFWSSVLDETEAFCDRIDGTPVTVEEWHRQRQVYLHREHADLLDLGFAAFFLNRTNRSGILAGRMIGGMSQTGPWKLDARFNKDELMRRIRMIGRYRTRIVASQLDAAAFIGETADSLRSAVLYFVDPPYIERGEKLYRNDYTLADHKALERQISEIDHHWIVTYDYDAAVRNKIHRGRTRLSFSLSYSAQRRRRGREAMFLSDSIELPPGWQGADLIPATPPKSKYPLEATVEAVSANDGSAQHAQT